MPDAIWFAISLATMVLGYIVGQFAGRTSGYDDGYVRGSLDATMSRLPEVYGAEERDKGVRGG